MSEFSIQISDPWDFKHPNNSNEFIVDSIGNIIGSDIKNSNHEYLLVNVNETFQIKNETVRQLICAPRYSGERLEEQIKLNNRCTIGIARIKDGIVYTAESCVNKSDVDYFAIGSIVSI